MPECAYDAGDCGMNLIKSKFPGTHVAPVDIHTLSTTSGDADVDRTMLNL